MGRVPENLSFNPNNSHYSEQTGHQSRGVVNRALKLAQNQNIRLSKGELFINRRFGMMRPQTPQGRKVV